MLCYTRHLMLAICVYLFFFPSAIFQSLEAACGGWGAYGVERPAWGGNGGWWGESRGNWYGEDYGAYDQHKTCSYKGYYLNHFYRRCPRYYYDDNVNGAGLYFNIR